MRVLIIRGRGGEGGDNDSGWYFGRALTALGHEVLLSDHDWLVRRHALLKRTARSLVFHATKGRVRLNLQWNADQALLRQVAAFKPDLLLVAGTKTVSRAAIQAVREQMSGRMVVNVFNDNPFFYDALLQTVPEYDHFFVKDTYVLQEMRKMGASNVHYLPQACDPEDHYRVSDMTPAERQYYGSDLSFVGSMYAYRLRILEVVADKDLKLWGTGWEGDIPKDSFAYAKHQRRGVIGREKCMVFTASKINLNTHNYQNDVFGVNKRLFEIASSGGFQVVDSKRDLARVFEPGREIVCFNSRDELRELVDQYLLHPEEREAIARRAQERAHREHTYRHRWEEIVQVTGLGRS